MDTKRTIDILTEMCNVRRTASERAKDPKNEIKFGDPLTRKYNLLVQKLNDQIRDVTPDDLIDIYEKLKKS